MDLNTTNIKFDEELEMYIVWRILTKSEMQAHLQNAQQRKANEENAIVNFQTYIEDPRTKENKELLIEEEVIK